MRINCWEKLSLIMHARWDVYALLSKPNRASALNASTFSDRLKYLVQILVYISMIIAKMNECCSLIKRMLLERVEMQFRNNLNTYGATAPICTCIHSFLHFWRIPNFYPWWKNPPKTKWCCPGSNTSMIGIM